MKNPHRNYVSTAEMPMLPTDQTAYFAAANARTSIMRMRAERRIRIPITSSPAIRKKALYEYRYYKTDGNGAVQDRR